MTDSKSSADPTDAVLPAEEIVAQAAALAAHLKRSGVHWLPACEPQRVEELSARFVTAEPEPDRVAEVEGAGAAAAASETKISGSSDTETAKAKSEIPAKTRPTSRVAPVAAFESAQGAYPGDDLSVDERKGQLELINAEVSECQKCEILASCRTKTVFGEGSASPRVVFFGEGPGADEDRSGRPFVGRAGQLLTKMIEACTFEREETYILNTVKCRPPGNRNPEADEIANCRSYYERQLAILRPEYIVCLGAVSAQELLKSKLSVGRLRGKLHGYFESKVLVTYHPAYLLRNPAAKKAAWADLQLMLQDAGIRV